MDLCRFDRGDRRVRHCSLDQQKEQVDRMEKDMRQIMTVNGREFEIRRMLGKGKGGYSYLASDKEVEYVLKQIHHEPCAYYQFGNKIEAERNDYERLCRIGISMPELLDIDVENERILKEYIEGDTVYDMVRKDIPVHHCIAQVRGMCEKLYRAGTNIDYFPTNFIVQNGILYYIDYECNDYMEEWNFENWGVRYWSKTEEFLQYVKEHEEQKG